MSNVKADPQIIRKIKADLNIMVKELQQSSSKIRIAISQSTDWTDVNGEQYRDLMRKIGRLIESPIDTLQGAQPKLEKLAQSLDEYNSVKF